MDPVVRNALEQLSKLAIGQDNKIKYVLTTQPSYNLCAQFDSYMVRFNLVYFPWLSLKRAHRHLQDSLQAKDAILSATANSLKHKDHSPAEEFNRRTQALDDAFYKLSLGQKGIESRITAVEKRLILELDEDAPAQHILATYNAPTEPASSCTFAWASVSGVMHMNSVSPYCKQQPQF